MLKKIITCIIFISILVINNVFASPSNNLTIQLGNLNLRGYEYLPKHDLFYEMIIPPSEFSKGAPLTGLIPYDGSDILTVIYRLDSDNIEVNLNISDPAIDNRIIWKGKVIYNRESNIIFTTPEIVDQHYIIYANIIQPDQGRPQLILGVVCL